MRILIGLATKKGWEFYQFDVNIAFVHGDLCEKASMEFPQGLLVNDKTMVCKLKKSLYGLKQASRQWYEKLAKALYSRGYNQIGTDLE